MNRPRCLLSLASILGALGFGGIARPAEPLRVTARVATPSPLHVGQAIEVEVEVPDAGGPVEILAPRPSEAEVLTRRASMVEAGAATARYMVVARRPGSLVVPPFRARSGDQSGTSRPTRLSIENVPAEGRTVAFLGGVGRFSLATEADPAQIRLGESLDYRLRLTGPAAWGSDRPPDLGGWASLAGGFRVEARGGELDVGDPVTRTFRYRVRPGRAGRWVLPPVTVAAFDPTTRRYATRVAPGVSIDVAEPPRFDPTGLNYGVGAPEAADRRAWRFVGVVGAIGSAVAAGWLLKRRSRASGWVDPRRLAADLIRALPEGGDQAEAARRVVEALATFLRLTRGRPPGVLTPPEARSEVEALTGDPDLAADAGRLVESCDRARFGGGSEDAGRLIALGRDLLRRLGEASGRGGGTEGGSRDR